MRKKNNQLMAPEVIVYTQLELPQTILSNQQSVEILRKSIIAQAQGEPVEVSAEQPLPLLMVAFDIVHAISPEMVLRLKTGERVLLFEHWGRSMIRDRDIILISKIEEKKHEKLDKFTPELIIDFGYIWNKITAPETDLKAIEKTLMEIKKSIKPSMVTTLVGKAPVLLFLLAQQMFYGQTGEIWYQENLISEPVRIARL